VTTSIVKGSANADLQRMDVCSRHDTKFQTQTARREPLHKLKYKQGDSRPARNADTDFSQIESRPPWGS